MSKSSFTHQANLYLQSTEICESDVGLAQDAALALTATLLGVCSSEHYLPHCRACRSPNAAAEEHIFDAGVVNAHCRKDESR